MITVENLTAHDVSQGPSICQAKISNQVLGQEKEWGTSNGFKIKVWLQRLIFKNICSELKILQLFKSILTDVKLGFVIL